MENFRIKQRAQMGGRELKVRDLYKGPSSVNEFANSFYKMLDLSSRICGLYCNSMFIPPTGNQIFNLAFSILYHLMYTKYNVLLYGRN